jgi:hypothetical protein
MYQYNHKDRACYWPKISVCSPDKPGTCIMQMPESSLNISTLIQHLLKVICGINIRLVLRFIFANYSIRSPHGFSKEQTNVVVRVVPFIVTAKVIT